MAQSDTDGLRRVASKEMDNQHMGRGKRGFVYAPGAAKGTGHDGNGTTSGGINRATKGVPQH